MNCPLCLGTGFLLNGGGRWYSCCCSSPDSAAKGTLDLLEAAWKNPDKTQGNLHHSAFPPEKKKRGRKKKVLDNPSI